MHNLSKFIQISLIDIQIFSFGTQPDNTFPSNTCRTQSFFHNSRRTSSFVTFHPSSKFFFIILLPQDLIETNQYTFRVYAENAAGPGKPSEPLGPIIAKDPFDKPGKPGQPEVTEVVADSATLAWAEPRDDGDSPITNYIVEMKRAGDFTWTNVSRYERYERNKCLR